MPEKTTVPAADNKRLDSTTKDRTLFQQVLRNCVRSERINLQGSVLIVGGSCEDVEILRSVGFRRITLTNLEDLADFKLPRMDGVEPISLWLDAEEMQLADSSYDVVLAHEVLHHCRSPHKALLEMLRVSRRHVIILEPNESTLMRAFVKLRFSFAYELPAVIFHNYRQGGVRNTCIPNYIFRWNERDMYQTTASFIPELEFSAFARSYWDFNVDENELALRTNTRIGIFTRIMGPSLFLACLHGLQAVVNRLPWLGKQGNKFFGCITKHDSLKPWLVREDGAIANNRNYNKQTR
jgi:SAM-dependent methyltransferase